MSNPTPDHNVTRDNQQTAYPCTFPACGSPGECCRPTCGSSAISAPTQPSGDGQRTPGDYIAIPEDGVEPSKWLRLGPCMAREIIAERDALRARVAELEAKYDSAHVDAVEFKKLAAFNRKEADDLRRAIGVECDDTIGEGIRKAKDLRAQLKEATEQIENLTAATIHSCGPTCQRPMCVLRRERDDATERADALQRECEQAREKQKELNRRCQHAESVIAKSGIMEGREQGPKNRSLGRALANYAAAQAYRERDTARDELAKWREAAEKLAEAEQESNAALVSVRSDRPSAHTDEVWAMLNRAINHSEATLTAYRALAAGQGEGAGR